MSEQRYYAIRPEKDRRPIEQRVCDTCRQPFDVRIPSVGQDWTTCPACETKQMMLEIRITALRLALRSIDDVIDVLLENILGQYPGLAEHQARRIRELARGALADAQP